MRRFSELGFLFTLVAAVEAVYALTALLTPPGQIEAVTGWVLSADGKWLVKLLGFALASQAWVAWTLRRQPHLGVAKALALYQLGSERFQFSDGLRVMRVAAEPHADILLTPENATAISSGMRTWTGWRSIALITNASETWTFTTDSTSLTSGGCSPRMALTKFSSCKA